MFVVCCSLFIVCCMFAVCRFGVYWLSVVVWLFVVCCLLFVVDRLMFVVVCCFCVTSVVC